jgi:hypothetical protein
LHNSVHQWLIFAFRAHPGQYLIATFHASHRCLLRARSSLRIRLHWVPAHVCIAGNEAVDARAKEAALGSSTELTKPVKAFRAPLLVSKAAAIAAGISFFKERWESEWNSSPQHLLLSLLGDTTPSIAIPRMYDDLSRPQCSVISQLRTGHIGVNAYLHRFNLAPSPTCSLCAAPETVAHFLLSCPKSRRERLKLMVKLGTARLSLKLLLGLKAELEPVLAYVRATERLPRYSL